jgi:hypothetical protein
MFDGAARVSRVVPISEKKWGESIRTSPESADSIWLFQLYRNANRSKDPIYDVTRVANAGWFTTGKPVPLQAVHVCSLIFGVMIFIWTSGHLFCA